MLIRIHGLIGTTPVNLEVDLPDNVEIVSTTVNTVNGEKSRTSIEKK